MLRKLTPILVGVTLFQSSFVLCAEKSTAIDRSPPFWSTNDFSVSYQFEANLPIEDRYATDKRGDSELVAVFDGHGGSEVSEYVRNALPDAIYACLEEGSSMEDSLVQGFVSTDAALRKTLWEVFRIGFDVNHVGSCAVVALRQGDKLTVANAGDCRAVLGRVSSGQPLPSSSSSSPSPSSALSFLFGAKQEQECGGTPRLAFSYGPDVRFEAKALSRDHNAREPEEQARLAQEHPGEKDIVVCKSSHACYVKGRLQPTRSFGDFYLKEEAFNGPPYDSYSLKSRGRSLPAPHSFPYISAQPEIESLTLSEKDAFLVLGSDGVFDFLSNQEVVDVVGKCLKEGRPEAAAKEIVLFTLQKAADEAGLTLQELARLDGRFRRRIFDDTTATVLFFQRQ